MPRRTLWRQLQLQQPSQALPPLPKHKTTLRTYWISTSTGQHRHLPRKNQTLACLDSKASLARPSACSRRPRMQQPPATTWTICLESSETTQLPHLRRVRSPRRLVAAAAVVVVVTRTCWMGLEVLTYLETRRPRLHPHSQGCSSRRRLMRISCHFSRRKSKHACFVRAGWGRRMNSD